MLEVKDREKVVGYMCFSNLTDNSSQLEKPSCLLHKKDYFLKIITGFIRFFYKNTSDWLISTSLWLLLNLFVLCWVQSYKIWVLRIVEGVTFTPII